MTQEIKTIKILGTGCSKCKRLENRIRKICRKHNKDAEIEKVENIDEMIKLGVIATPALVVDGEVKATGRIPGKKEILRWL